MQGNVAGPGAGAMGLPSTAAAGQSRFPGVGLPGTLQQQLAAHSGLQGGLQGGFGARALGLGGVHTGQPFGLGGAVNGMGNAGAARGSLGGGLGMPSSALAQGNPGMAVGAGARAMDRTASGTTLGALPPAVNPMQRATSGGTISGALNGPRIGGPGMGGYGGAPAPGLGGGFPRPAGMMQYGQAAVPQGDLLALINNKVGQVMAGYGGAPGLPSGSSLSSLVGGQQGDVDNVPFDPSEFPSLSNSRPGSGSGLGQLELEASYGAAALGQKHSEFSIQNEDFPALPGAPKTSGDAYGMDGQRFPTLGSRGGLGPYSDQHPLSQAAAAQLRGVPGGSGFLSKMPGLGGVTLKSSAAGSGEGRFGLLGLLNVIRMNDVDLSTLALGTDLTTLGLNLNQSDMLYKTFTSPWAEGPGRPEPEIPTPACYLQQSPRLVPAMFTKFSLDSLLYAFYSAAGEESQRLSAEELLSRGWMWHKEHKVWLARVPGTEPTMKTDRFERGSFVVFDVNSWERVRKDNFVLQYDQLLESARSGPLRRE